MTGCALLLVAVAIFGLTWVLRPVGNRGPGGPNDGKGLLRHKEQAEFRKIVRDLEERQP